MRATLGLSRAVAKDMAHVPIDGATGSHARLSELRARKIYTHINNLRRKLEADPTRPTLILGVRGVGYRFGG